MIEAEKYLLLLQTKQETTTYTMKQGIANDINPLVKVATALIIGMVLGLACNGNAVFSGYFS